MKPLKLHKLSIYLPTIEEGEFRITSARINFYVPDELFAWSSRFHIRQLVECQYDISLSLAQNIMTKQ